MQKHIIKKNSKKSLKYLIKSDILFNQ